MEFQGLLHSFPWIVCHVFFLTLSVVVFKDKMWELTMKGNMGRLGRCLQGLWLPSWGQCYDAASSCRWVRWAWECFSSPSSQAGDGCEPVELEQRLVAKAGAIAETTVSVPSLSTLFQLCCAALQHWWKPAPLLLVSSDPCGDTCNSWTLLVSILIAPLLEEQPLFPLRQLKTEYSTSF